MGVIGAVGYFLNAHLQLRCREAIQSLGSSSLCRLSFGQTGVEATFSQIIHSSGLRIDHAQLALSWDKVLVLFRQPKQRFPFAEPLSISLSGSMTRPGRALTAGFAGNIQLIGDGSDLRQVDFDLELTGLSKEHPEDGHLRGSLRRTDPQNSASSPVYRLQCDACVFTWGVDRVDFGVDAKYQLASQGFELPLSFSFASLRLGLVNDLGFGTDVPGEIARLKATGNVLLGPDSSLDITELKGPISLKSLREILILQLAKRNEKLAGVLEFQRHSLVRWFPDEVTVTSGTARLDSKWTPKSVGTGNELDSLLRGEWELERHSSRVQLKTTLGEFGQTQIELWHETVTSLAASAAATEPKGEIRLNSAQAGDISLDFSLIVRRMDRRYHIESKFGMSDAEATRLANLWSAKLADKLGLPGQPAILSKVPSSAEMKSIEKLGKSWIKGFVEREQAADPARKDAAKEQMRASEKELKEALRKFLKQ